MNIFVSITPSANGIIVVYKNKAKMLLLSSCRISLIYFLHNSIKTVFDNFKDICY